MENKRKKSIYIDGAKLRKLIEEKTGKSIYDASEDQGFSRNFLAEASRTGIASPTVQTVVKLIGIEPEEYEAKEIEEKKEEPEDKQLSFFDMMISKEELKRIVKDAVREELAALSFGMREAKKPLTAEEKKAIAEAFKKGV